MSEDVLIKVLSSSATALPALSHNDALRCPECGNDDLHHERVVVRQRVSEDDRGTSFEVVGMECHRRNLEAHSKEFAGRRNDFDVYFWCEHCGQACQYILNICQHKGKTYLLWVGAQEAPPDSDAAPPVSE